MTAAGVSSVGTMSLYQCGLLLSWISTESYGRFFSSSAKVTLYRGYNYRYRNTCTAKEGALLLQGGIGT